MRLLAAGAAVVFCIAGLLRVVYSFPEYTRVRQDPGNFTFQLEYVIKLCDEGRFDQASEHAESVKADVSYVYGLLLKGVAELSAGRRAGADAVWDAAGESVYDDRRVWTAFERFLVQQGLYRRAFTLLRDIPAEQRQLDDYWRLSGYAHMAGEIHTAIVSLFEYLMRNIDAYGRVQRQLHTIISDAAGIQYLEAAVAHVLDAEPEEPGRELVLRLEISMLISAAAYDAAVEKSRAFFLAYPDEQSFMLHLLRSFSQAGRDDAALLLAEAVVSEESSDALRLEYAELLLESNPSLALTYAESIEPTRNLLRRHIQLRFLALGRLGRFNEALALWQDIAAPDTALRIRAGAFALLTGDSAGAKQFFSRLPAEERLYYTALSLTAEEAVESARETVQPFLNNPGAGAVVHEALGLWFGLGKIEKSSGALAAFNRVVLSMLRKEPAAAGEQLAELAGHLGGVQRAFALISAARLHVYAGQYETAVAALGRGQWQSSELADHALFWEAAARSRRGEKEKADSILLGLVAQYPDSVYIYYARELLENGMLTVIP